MMSRVQRSFENFALLQAASEGSATAVRDALQSGADINASDNSGRTILTCALTADRWETIDASDASFLSDDRLEVLRIAVSHPEISLFTLNAPQDSINDVTPLGMAAWLDMPQAVQVLLDCSSGAVSVDAEDTDGATPLMSRADLRYLIALRDRNHRSSLQFALPHPRVLWTCEQALRNYRLREYQNGNKRGLCKPSLVINHLSPQTSTQLNFAPSIPPATTFSSDSIYLVTDSVVQAVLAADLSVLYPLLLSQSFEPSPLDPGPILVNILDALYRAGADVSLFTTGEHYTPLHCFARLARVCDDIPESPQLLYQFAIHLIRDLRAPLAAPDKHDETCIHVAAEHGECLDVLLALLDCDTTGTIRNLRNSRGLTAFEVARPIFRSAFSPDGQFIRPESSLSDRTIRPGTSSSITSVTSFTDRTTPLSPPTIRISNGPASHLPLDFDATASTERLLENFTLLSTEAQFVRDHEGLDRLASVVNETSQLGGQVDDAASDLRDMRAALNAIDHLWNTTSHDVEEHLRALPDGRSLERFLERKRSPRDSEDSQTTAVEVQPIYVKSILKETEPKVYADASVLSDPSAPVPLETTTASGARTVPWPEWLDSFILSADSTTYKAHLANLIEIDAKCSLKSLLRSRKRYEKVEKKKIMAEKPLKLQIVYDLDSECAVGREVKVDFTQLSITISDSEKPSRAASLSPRDLSSIDECLHGVDHLISTACHSISRAERIIKRAIKTREAMVQNLLLNISLAATIHDDEDEDSRALRRLLLRKISARIDGAFDDQPRK
ncbi:ankyrin repeat-containing domain protein, partial [Suillus cothurnatus]